MASTSDDWFARAQRVIPGGVSSPVRAFRSVGGVPRYVAHARGSRITSDSSSVTWKTTCRRAQSP